MNTIECCYLKPPSTLIHHSISFAHPCSQMSTDRGVYEQPPLNFSDVASTDASNLGTNHHFTVNINRNTRSNQSRTGYTLNGDQSTNESTFSFRSTRDISQFVKEENGRTFNTLNETYWLPTGTFPLLEPSVNMQRLRLGPLGAAS